MSAELKQLRLQAVSIFLAGIKAADPYRAVQNYLRIENNRIEILFGPKVHRKTRTEDWKKVHLLAFGKAACSMAKAAVEIIPAEKFVKPGIIVTNEENNTIIKNCDVYTAGHPLPNQDGLQAAKILANQAQKAQINELALVLISGGGSALLPLPAPGISLEEKKSTTLLLLKSGATINQINCVRKHLSQLKGGGLARMTAPADLHALILSDVIGDDVSAIASGPTVPDETSFANAIEVCQSKHIWKQLPEKIRRRFIMGAAGKIQETPKKHDPIFTRAHYSLIASNTISVNAIKTTAEKLGFTTLVYSDHLCGEAKDEAKKLVVFTKKIIEHGIGKPVAILAGGETTVTVCGSGRGGRNQEMALAFALAAKQNHLPDCWIFLSGGTDGRDGPTDAAGGIVDPKTLERISEAKLDPYRCLKENDSYTALKASRDLLETGATGTNVADLQVLLILPIS